MYLTFRQMWNDSRLAYDDQDGKIKYVTLQTTEGRDSIWIPDTFFRNSLEELSHDLPTPNEYLRVFPNGDVLHSQRLAVKLACLDSIQYKLKEAGQFECKFRIASCEFPLGLKVYEVTVLLFQTVGRQTI